MAYYNEIKTKYMPLVIEIILRLRLNPWYPDPISGPAYSY